MVDLSKRIGGAKRAFPAGHSGDDFMEVALGEEGSEASFVGEVLEGRHGESAQTEAVRVLVKGVGYGGDFSSNQPVTDFWLMRGRVDIIRAVMDAGVPQAFCTDSEGTKRQRTLTDWIDALSRAVNEGEDEGQEHGLLGYAAWRSTLVECKGYGIQAMGLLWEMGIGRDRFWKMAAEESDEGLAVREFLELRMK